MIQRFPVDATRAVEIQHHAARPRTYRLRYVSIGWLWLTTATPWSDWITSHDPTAQAIVAAQDPRAYWPPPRLPSRETWDTISDVVAISFVLACLTLLLIWSPA